MREKTEIKIVIIQEAKLLADRKVQKSIAKDVSGVSYDNEKSMPTKRLEISISVSRISISPARRQFRLHL